MLGGLRISCKAAVHCYQSVASFDRAGEIERVEQRISLSTFETVRDPDSRSIVSTGPLDPVTIKLRTPRYLASTALKQFNSF